jgi:hypothetical protein
MKLKALFAGCARNCAASLPSVLHNIERISSLYAQAAFVFMENDSEDDTKGALRDWCNKHKNAFLISIDGLARAEVIRTMRMATVRRQCVAMLNSYFKDYSHLIVIDCDDSNEMEIDLEAARRAVEFLESDASHGGVFANQLGTYYDVWAFRHPTRCPGDAWEEVLDCVARTGASDQDAFDRTFATRLFSLPPDSGPLEVDSAFGGFGIYKVASVLHNERSYVGYKQKTVLTSIGPRQIGLQVCEHVSFNLGLRERYQRLFVFPSLINRVTDDVSFPPGVFRTMMFDLRLATPRGRVSFPMGEDAPCLCGSRKRFRDCHGAQI